MTSIAEFFVVLVTTPLAFIRTLVNCRISNGRWDEYPHFTPNRAIWSLGYWFWGETLARNGRYGKTPTLFMEPQSNTMLFMYSTAAMRLYRRFGAISLPVAMGLWWLSHLVYFDQTPLPWLALVLCSLFCASSFYGLCFSATNYHAYAFAFLPLALYGLLCDQPVLAAAAFAAAVSMSPQAGVLIAGAAAWYALVGLTWLPLAAFLPATLLGAFLYLWPLFRAGELKKRIVDILHYLFHRDPKKQAKAEKLSPFFWCYLLRYGLFAAIAINFSGLESPLKYFALYPVLLLLFNTVVRLTDLQNVVQVALAVIVALCLLAPGWVLWFALLIALTPPARFVVFHGMPHVKTAVPTLAPVHIEPVIARLLSFLDRVPQGARLYVAYPHPGDWLSRSGFVPWYREFLLEQKIYPWYIENLFLYAGWRKGVSFFPSGPMLSVAPEHLPHAWGRNPMQTVESMRYLDANYAFYYAKHDEPIDHAAFHEAGLESVETLSADDFARYFPKDSSPFADKLIWHLLTWRKGEIHAR